MSFLELAKSRYSVRDFSDKPVELEKLDLILEAGKIAPTAKNNQPQKVYVVQSEEGIAKLNELTRCIYGAKTVILVCKDTELEWNNPLEEGITSGDTDVGIVVTHMMLEAWELGIASCWVGFFPPTETQKAFDLPENEIPVALLPIGYAAEGVEPAPRHTLYRDGAKEVKSL